MSNDIIAPYVVAVHGGAGFHRPSSDPSLKQALKTACQTSTQNFPSATSRSVISLAISSLEDDPLLNAGLGSNLTFEGHVECDAAIMESENEAFGSVAAVSGIKNPIQVAQRLLEKSQEPSANGLIPPMTLASSGALTFAVANEIPTIPPELLITERSLREWRLWRSRISEGKEFRSASSLDTVGAVVLDCSGNLAAGVSSGGLLLKHPGRVGQAAVYGAGCYAMTTPGKKTGVACSVSGEGEYIIRASLARRIVEAVSRNVNEAEGEIVRVMKQELRAHAQAGVLVLVSECEEGESTAQLLCAFTTKSMAVGYVSSWNKSPKARIIRRPDNQSTGVFLQALPLRQNRM